MHKKHERRRNDFSPLLGTQFFIGMTTPTPGKEYSPRQEQAPNPERHRIGARPANDHRRLRQRDQRQRVEEIIQLFPLLAEKLPAQIFAF